MSERKSATRVEEWRVEDLRPYKGNPRKVPPRALKAVRASIRRFGVVAPLVITPDGAVIAGHTRLLALKAEGIDTVRCIVFEGGEAEARAYGLADNRTGELTYWDVDKLAAEVTALDEDIVS